MVQTLVCVEAVDSRLRQLSVSLFQLRARLPVNDSSQFSFALVVQLLTFGHAHLKLDFTMLYIDAGYYQRHALRGRSLIELVNLAPMQQQLSGPQRIVIGAVAVRVRRDVRVEQPRFTFT